MHPAGIRFVSSMLSAPSWDLLCCLTVLKQVGPVGVGLRVVHDSVMMSAPGTGCKPNRVSVLRCGTAGTQVHAHAPLWRAVHLGRGRPACSPPPPLLNAALAVLPHMFYHPLVPAGSGQAVLLAIRRRLCHPRRYRRHPPAASQPGRHAGRAEVRCGRCRGCCCAVPAAGDTAAAAPGGHAGRTHNVVSTPTRCRELAHMYAPLSLVAMPELKECLGSLKAHPVRCRCCLLTRACTAEACLRTAASYVARRLQQVAAARGAAVSHLPARSPQPIPILAPCSTRRWLAWRGRCWSSGCAWRLPRYVCPGRV